MSKLYIVPSPIGNLEDITFRALKVLEKVDLVLAEDTRRSGILLKKYNIDKKVLSHHSYNEHQHAGKLALRMKGGETMALLSEAGTPGISDPGFLLVRECLRENLEIECLPGPTAFIPALVASGLPSDRFCFEGFLPHKKGRQRRLDELKAERRTMIFYESPHRVLKCLNQFAGVFGADRQACLARELTKIHEEYIRGTIADIINALEGKDPRGECVILVAGK
jgi:16S rRNA (cytidine1402-2'-O)-methyltransferase